MARTKNPAYFGFAVFLILFSAVLSPTLNQAQTPEVMVVVDITYDGVVSGQSPTKRQALLTGEPVNLAYLAFGGGVSVVSPTWEVDGTAIAGFTPTLQGEGVKEITQADIEKPSLKFYWIDQGPKQVTLTYDLSGGCVDARTCRGHGSATAYFDVQGPTDVKVPADEHHPLFHWEKAGFFDGDGGKWVGLGAGKSDPGIEFSVSATYPAMRCCGNGQFQWVQLVTGDVMQYRGPNALCTEASTGGVDPPFPKQTYLYGTGTGLTNDPITGLPAPIEDSVGGILGSAKKYNQTWRDFSAVMYLMWKAYGNNDYIPVPLGYVAWSTDWTLVSAPKSDPPWAILNAHKSASPFEPYAHYAHWVRQSQIVQTYNSQPGECP